MKSNQELIKELRAVTQAGMKDCKDALVESNWDLDQAIDIVKAKGLANTSRNAGKLASEGLLTIVEDFDTRSATMVEVNCQTDFVANSPDFKSFVYNAGVVFSGTDLFSYNGDLESLGLEQARKELMATTKENVVVRRWFRTEAAPNGVVAVYLHSNAKIGVMLSLEASTPEIANSKELLELGQELAMQVAAMNPIAVAREALPQEELDRQKGIFETQLAELKKPQAAWAKIMDGKFNKWYTDVCLMDQESVVYPKTSVKQVADAVAKKLGGEIKVLSFVRAAVGEGIEKQQDDLASAVAEAIEGSK